MNKKFKIGFLWKLLGIDGLFLTGKILIDIVVCALVIGFILEKTQPIWHLKNGLVGMLIMLGVVLIPCYYAAKYIGRIFNEEIIEDKK